MGTGTLYRIAKRPFFGRYWKPWRWPQGVERDGWQPVEFASATGATLAGLHGRALGGSARGAVVLAHPMGTAGKGFFLKGGHARLLRERGFDVLLFDFNGFGESGMGDFRYPLDVVAAGEALGRLSPGLPLGVLGVSFGAAWATCALALPGQPFRAAVLEAPFTTLEEFWRRYPFPYAVLRALHSLRPRLAAALRPIDRIREVGGGAQLLLVLGEADGVTPPVMGARLLRALRASAAASPSPEWFPWPQATAESWIVPGAGHTRALAEAPAAYAERVTGFLSRALRPAPSSTRA